MPACATRYAGRPPISAPRKRTQPALGLSAPAMRLQTVLLPEPLGPIRPRISPSATSNETLLTAVKPPNLFVSCSTSSKSRREGVALGERQHRVARLDGARPRDIGAAGDVLRHHRERALVLAGELAARRIELHAVALQRAARRDVGVERRLAQRLGVEAAVFPNRARQHVGEEDPGVVEPHGDVRRHLARALHRLVALHHLARQLADARLERLRVEQLRGRRIDGVEIVDVVAEALAQLVDLAVPGAVADHGLELQALLLRLAQEQRDVGVVAGVEQHVGTRALELGDQAGQVGRGRRVAFLEHDVHAVLPALRLVARGDAGAVRPVLVDDGDPHVLRRDAEFRLRVVIDVVARGGAELVAVRLRAEHVGELPVLEHRGGDAHVHPQELLAGIDLLHHGHALRARVHAHDEVDLLLVDEARHLVDRDVDLRLRVGEHGVDPVALDAAFLVEQVDRRLGAELRRLRAAAGERAGDVVDEADLDFLLLRRGRTGERKRHYRGHRVAKLHGTPPLARSLADVRRCYTGRLQEKAMPTSIRYLPLLLALAALPLCAETVRVYVTNSAGDNIHVIDPATNKVVQVINGVEAAHGIDFSPDGQRVYVSNEADSALDVIDARALKLARTIPVNGRLHNVYVTPDNKYVVTGSIRSKVLTVIDLKTDQIAWELKLDEGVRPMTMEVNPDGSTRRIFAQLSNFNGFAVVDFAARKEVARIKLPDEPGGFGVIERRTDAPSHGIGVAPDGKTLWVTSITANGVFAYSLPDLRLLGFAALPELRLPGRQPISAVPNWVTFTPDSRLLYISNAGARSVSAIDTRTIKSVAIIPVGEVPKRINTLVLP